MSRRVHFPIRHKTSHNQGRRNPIDRVVVPHVEVVAVAQNTRATSEAPSSFTLAPLPILFPELGQSNPSHDRMCLRLYRGRVSEPLPTQPLPPAYHILPSISVWCYKSARSYMQFIIASIKLSALLKVGRMNHRHRNSRLHR